MYVRVPKTHISDMAVRHVISYSFIVVRLDEEKPTFLSAILSFGKVINSGDKSKESKGVEVEPARR